MTFDPREVARFIGHLVLMPLYALSHLVPRKRTRIAFGSNHHDFNGNAKYLFLHFREHCPDVEVAWISPGKAVRDELRERGHPAYCRDELAGIAYTLRAKFYVYSGRRTDINFWTSGGVIDLNLWHGVGIKGLGFTSNAPVNRRLFRRSALQRFMHPWLHLPPSFMVTTSPWMTEHFAGAFDLPTERCLADGLPRSDHFFLDRAARERLLETRENAATRSLIASLRGFDRVYIYLPTYRDSGVDFIQQSQIDFERLQRQMAEDNALFLFKLHPRTKLALPAPGRFPNLRFLDGTVDVYPLLPETDVLVTDYSSVYYDFILLDKPIVLFAFDEDAYVAQERDLIADYRSHTPGPRARTFDELLVALRDPKPLPAAERDRIRELFWGDYAGHASERIASRLRALVSGERGW
jgi:CDP-glycerol glycerophosphotransferase (TagB/SpsB family)